MQTDRLNEILIQSKFTGYSQWFNSLRGARFGG